MKKSVLLIVGLLVTAVSAVAQPKKPTVSYSDWASVEETADIYFYNVEAGMFLVAGNYWGTRACIIGGGNQSNIITYEKFLLGNGTVTGNKWFISISEKTANGQTCYTFQNKSGSNNLSADASDGIWVDGGNGRPVTNWYIAKDNGDKTFSLGYYIATAQKDAEGNDLKDDEGNIIYDYAPMGYFGAQKFEEGDIMTYFDKESTKYATWAIVSQAEYDRVQPLLALYYAGQGLQKLINDAETLNLDMDLSAEKALLVQDGVTLEELNAAIKKINPSIAFAKVIAEAKEFDASRSWAKFEAICSDESSTDAIFTENTALINSLIALKKAINEGKELDAAHAYTNAEGVYASDASTKEEIDGEKARVNAYISLKKKLNEATEQYPSLDFSEPTATYTNAEATSEDLANAETKIQAISNNYKMNQASLDKPDDISNKLTNIDGKTIDNWERTFTGTGTVGTFHLNTWSTEGNAGNDGTNMTNPFIEDWVAKGSTLSDQKFYRKTITVEPGAYKITGNVRLYNESGATYMKGAYLYANSNRKSFFANDAEDQTNAVDGAQYGTYNTMLFYWKDGFDTYTIVPESGELTFGIQLEGVNFNWAAAKDFHVYYLGDSYESLDYVRKNTELTLPSFDENTLAKKDLLNAYIQAETDYKSATTADAITSAYATMLANGDALQANIAAYKAYANKIESYKNKVEEEDLNGENADKLIDYLDEQGVDFGPESDEAADYGFANGYSAYILANAELDTEAIQNETEFLTSLYEAAVRTSLKDGSDLTGLIKNPGFEEGTSTATVGWKLDTSKGGTDKLTNWHGGKNNHGAEAYQQNFDVYQEIDNVEDGLYELSVQAFYRTGSNNDAWAAFQSDPAMEGAAKVYPEVYINEFSSKVRNVMEIQYANGELDESNTGTYNPEGTEVYTLNSMDAASNAFSIANPERNFTMSAYGLVQGGKIRIGIRKLEGPTGGSVWTLWDNFKLTYRAKNHQVLTNVLEQKSAELGKIIDNEQDNLTTPALSEANYRYNESIKSDLSNDAKWDMLIETNRAINAARQNLLSVEENKTLTEAYNTATDELAKYDPSEQSPVWNEITSMDAELAAFDALTTEELDDLNTRVKELTTRINKAALETATDDEPRDVTATFIKNPDMEQANGDNIMPGWEDFWKERGNGPVKGSDGITGRSLEAWAGTVGKDLKFSAFQKLTGLPAGKYELSADAANASNGVKADEDAWNSEDESRHATGRAYLVAYADGKAYSTPVVPNIGRATEANRYTVIFTVGEDGEAQIGFQSKGDLPFRWFMCDNFKLMYFGNSSAQSDNADEGDLVAIEGTEVAPANKAITGIFTATGAQIPSLQKGINIVKYSDGSVRKVFVK